MVEPRFRQKPAENACPMVTLCVEAARAPGDIPLRAAFAHGLDRVGEIVAGDPLAPERLVSLTAMVGTSILSESGGSTELVERMQAAIASFRDTAD